MDSEQCLQLKTRGLQKHSNHGTPLFVFNHWIEVRLVGLEPLLFIDREVTLRPKKQWDIQ